MKKYDFSYSLPFGILERKMTRCYDIYFQMYDSFIYQWLFPLAIHHIQADLNELSQVTASTDTSSILYSGRLCSEPSQQPGNLVTQCTQARVPFHSRLSLVN